MSLAFMMAMIYLAGLIMDMFNCPIGLCCFELLLGTCTDLAHLRAEVRSTLIHEFAH